MKKKYIEPTCSVCEVTFPRFVADSGTPQSVQQNVSSPNIWTPRTEDEKFVFD